MSFCIIVNDTVFDKLQTNFILLLGTTFFTIDSSSGVITSTKVFDYETESGTYIFQVGLFDNGSPPLYANEYQIALHIRNVNEYTPTFSSLSYSGTVAEKTAAGNNKIILLRETTTSSMAASRFKYNT